MKIASSFLALALSLSATAVLAADPELASGAAKGTFVQKGETTATLTNAAAFVDVKDSDKPIIVIVSDKKLPTEKWTSEFDLMEAKSTLKFSGIVFWIKDGEVNRTDIYWNGRQASVSGYFDVKLDSKPGDKEIKGSIKGSSSDEDAPKPDVTFHATLK